MKKEISRRDFCNGLLIAAGGLAVSQSVPLRYLLANSGANEGDGSIDLDPRALRGGNLPATFEVAHWLRDRRLTFTASEMKVIEKERSSGGSFPIQDESQSYDVIIVGSGISGLSTAFYLLRKRPGARILILDGNGQVGGNAGRDDKVPLPVPASTGGSYCVAPYDESQKELYSALKVNWEEYKVLSPMYNYYFDDRTPGVQSGYRGWNIDTYGKGLKTIPYASETIQQLVKCKEKFIEWSKKEGAPTDPIDSSDPKYDSLSEITLHDYLTKNLECNSIVSDFYTRYTIDALAGTTKQVNAHSSIDFLGAEYGDIFAFPGGASGLPRHLLKWLIPDSIEGSTSSQLLSKPIRIDKLDHSQQKVRIRQNAVALQVDQDGLGSKNRASVIYYQAGKVHRVRGKAVVLAGQAHTAQHLVGHLVDDRRKQAWRQFKAVPVVVANVLIESAAPLVDLGLGYNQYWWGSKYWADFVVADWVTQNRLKRDRPTVLTFYGGNTAPVEDLPGERFKLLTTPFGSYEESIKDDLSRIMKGSKFDFDRDVKGIFVYRWGHGMIHPSVGFSYGTTKLGDGRLDRTKGPRAIACSQLGRISFAGQDSEGTPSVESAMSSGLRAAEEVIRLI